MMGTEVSMVCARKINLNGFFFVKELPIGCCESVSFLVYC